MRHVPLFSLRRRSLLSLSLLVSLSSSLYHPLSLLCLLCPPLFFPSPSSLTVPLSLPPYLFLLSLTSIPSISPSPSPLTLLYPLALSLPTLVSLPACCGVWEDSRVKSSLNIIVQVLLCKDDSITHVWPVICHSYEVFISNRGLQ